MKDWFESKNNVIIHKMITANEMNDVQNVSIANLYDVEIKSTVNVIGACFEVGDLKSFYSGKTQNEMKKRPVTITDQSQIPIILILWNLEAEEFESKFTDSILSIKNGQIIEKNGQRFITNIGTTILTQDPDVIEAYKLRDWYNSEGKRKMLVQLSKMALNGLK